ncbi:hypothetical protein BJV74DRAFT_988361 [Russula compacta]|nr:hypothetical protein BJV74DRAFT_988361 [Russula compacta]
MEASRPTRMNKRSPHHGSQFNKPPDVSGTLRLPATCFSLFYKITKDSHTARHIDLANATFDKLEQLAQPSVGVNEIPSTWTREDRSTQAQRVQGHSSSLISTLRAVKTCLGHSWSSFQREHEDGSLLLRHRGYSWSFNSVRGLAAVHAPPIGFVSLFDDIEYEVSPVISGHYVMWTYNLYLDDGGPVSAYDPAGRGTLLPDGELMRIPWRHAWIQAEAHLFEMKDDIKDVYGLLKGSDAVVYRSAREIGFGPVLYILSFEDQSGGEMMKDLTRLIRERGGIVVCEDPDLHRDLICHARIRERGSNGRGILDVKSQATTETKNPLESGLFGPYIIEKLPRVIGTMGRRDVPLPL